MSGTEMPEKQSEPKRYKIPSREWGITCDEAADILIAAIEIKKNKPLLKEALAKLKAKKETINQVV